MKTKNTRLRKKDVHYGKVAYIAEPGYPVKQVIFLSGVVPDRFKYEYTKGEFTHDDNGAYIPVEGRAFTYNDSFPADRVRIGLYEGVLPRVFFEMTTEDLFGETQVRFFKKRKQAEEYLRRVPDIKTTGESVMHDLLA